MREFQWASTFWHERFGYGGSIGLFMMAFTFILLWEQISVKEKTMRVGILLLYQFFYNMAWVNLYSNRMMSYSNYIIAYLLATAALQYRYKKHRKSLCYFVTMFVIIFFIPYVFQAFLLRGVVFTLILYTVFVTSAGSYFYLKISQQ